MVFGYDTAVISGTIPFIKSFFQLDDLMLGVVVSSALVGCIPGAMLVGKPADQYGRKPVLFTVAVLFLISAIGSGCANIMWGLVFFALSAASPWERRPWLLPCISRKCLQHGFAEDWWRSRR